VKCFPPGRVRTCLTGASGWLRNRLFGEMIAGKKHNNSHAKNGFFIRIVAMKHEEVSVNTFNFFSLHSMKRQA
jgi:hypothetical protein